MSAYPLMLDGSRLEALIVGGGRVAERKAEALLECGARVRLVAPRIAPSIRQLADRYPQLRVEQRPYDPRDIGDAALVIAATDVRDVNAAVAGDARRLGRFVNVSDRPDEGTCVTAAVHRSGPLVIAVTAGGVPTAASRVRDALAARFDDRYGEAVETLVALRRRLLDAGDDAGWRAVVEDLLGADFVADVERGTFTDRAAVWTSGPETARHPERVWH